MSDPFHIDSKQASAPRSQSSASVASPTPWELIEANENHGAYIVNAYGADVCDLYAMSNPTAASVRNGGNSFPVHFTDAAANASLIVMAVNQYDAHESVALAALEMVACGTPPSPETVDRLCAALNDLMKAKAER